MRRACNRFSTTPLTAATKHLVPIRSAGRSTKSRVGSWSRTRPAIRPSSVFLLRIAPPPSRRQGNLLTYVKISPSARWKLASSSEILGPTNLGVAMPAVASDRAGYVTSIDPAAGDGLVTAPDKVPTLVAAAFSSEASSGKLPVGISAQFGPKNVADPHSIAASYASIGTVSVQFTAKAPAAVAKGAPSRDCPYPALRLADGGALVTFAVFETVVVHVRAGNVVVQPSNRSALGVLLPPGTYSSVTILAGDMQVAIDPPSGSSSPIEVIGQASEELTETGVPGSGSSSSSGSGGLVNASSIANAGGRRAR